MVTKTSSYLHDGKLLTALSIKNIELCLRHEDHFALVYAKIIK